MIDLSFNSDSDNEFESNINPENMSSEDLIFGLFKELIDVNLETQRMIQELVSKKEDNSVTLPAMESDSCNIRPCNNFSLSAINTSIPAQRISDSLFNMRLKNQRDPEIYDTTARILLYGVSGGGKTTYVEWLSRRLCLPLHYLRFSDVVDSNVGATEKNIRNAFAEARQKNAILFIDECDSLIMDRKGCHETWELSQVNEFLIQIERYPGILFCATNYADKLDSATDRRFHFKIEFFPCTRKQIELLLNSYFPMYVFSESQISKIADSGAVVPGDFGTLSGRLRFSADEDISSDFITSELCDIVKAKKENQNSHLIGFSA